MCRNWRYVVLCYGHREVEKLLVARKYSTIYVMINGKEKQKDGSEEKEYDVVIDNGDLKLIDSLVAAYKFKDRDSLIKFAIAALLEGNNDNGIFTVKTAADGKKVLSKIAPPDDMLAGK